MNTANTVALDREDPRYIANELLLTFTSMAPQPPDSFAAVLRLVRKAQDIAGIGDFTLVEPQQRQQDKPTDPLAALEEVIEDVAHDLAAEDEPRTCSLDKDVDRALGLLQQLAGRRDGDDGDDADGGGDGDDADGGGDGKPELTLQQPLTVRIGLPRLVVPTMRDIRVTIGVNRINTSIGELRDDGVAVSSAMPNWILSSAGTGVHGGPGTVPSPVPEANDGHWEFDIPAAFKSSRGDPDAADQQVVVAVLDTWPGRGKLKRAAAQFGTNWLMTEMQQMAEGDRLTVWEPPLLGPAVPQRMTNTDADHGLFVAGVIHSIAHHAEIHVLRVLDQYGLGSTDTVLAALKHCLALTGAGRRVVVNLSLYLLIPPDDAPENLWDYWFSADPYAAQRPPSQNAALLEFLDERVEGTIAQLLDAGAVIIAAAGNDALDYGTAANPDHLQPRLPADYDTVCCVVAADEKGAIATYSNRADMPLNGNGVATWGGQGEVVVEGANTRVVVPGGEGVVGLFTGPDVATHNDNKTGWVYWSGTSFATPVISGMAANVLARNEAERQVNPAAARLSARGVINAILAQAVPAAQTDAALGCPYVRVTQLRA